MKSITLILSLLLSWPGQAEFYDHQDLQIKLQQPLLQKRLQTYSQRYFTAANPHQVVDELLAANIPDLHKEAILYALLTDISQSPPQDFHQYLVDQMKTYQPQTSVPAEEGHLPVVAFNLNSRAHGIENIWTAYRTEQKFLALFQNDLKTAMTDIRALLQLPISTLRPQWLGVKNALSALPQSHKLAIANHLITQVDSNQGLDKLISHVGLVTAEKALLLKALQSHDVSVRQHTLRHLPNYVDQSLNKDLLLLAKHHTQDLAFVTSLMSPFLDDPRIAEHVMQQLKNPTVADQAAFALSRSPDPIIYEKLRRQFLNSDAAAEKNHIILALKLSSTEAAQWVLSDVEAQLTDDSASKQWLNSFQGGER